jgi:hypothetical protein
LVYPIDFGSRPKEQRFVCDLGAKILKKFSLIGPGKVGKYSAQLTAKLIIHQKPSYLTGYGK